MRPWIGITCSIDDEERRLRLNASYVQAVETAGGLPVLLGGGAEVAREVLSRLDGVLFSGGVDLDPSYFGEQPHAGLGDVSPQRDAFEMILAQEAHRLGVPSLGICRGCQLLAVAGGGTLYQDLQSQLPGSLQHSQRAPRRHKSHPVAITAGTRLREIASGEAEIRVNSFHHQAVRRLPEGSLVAATAPDGVIEAFEDPSHPHWLAVQWHPEELWQHDEVAMDLFRSLVAAAQEVRARAR